MSTPPTADLDPPTGSAPADPGASNPGSLPPPPTGTPAGHPPPPGPGGGWAPPPPPGWSGQPAGWGPAGGVPTGPNIPRRRRALRFLVISVVVALIGIALTGFFGVKMFRDITVFASDLLVDTEAGGADTVHLEPGKYFTAATGRMLGGSDGDRSFSYPRMRITDPSGAELPLRATNFTSRTTQGNRSIVILDEFTVEEGGTHLLEVADERSADAQSIGIAEKKGFSTGRIAGTVVGFGLTALGGIAFVISAIIAILAQRERIPIEPGDADTSSGPAPPV